MSAGLAMPFHWKKCLILASAVKVFPAAARAPKFGVVSLRRVVIDFGRQQGQNGSVSTRAMQSAARLTEGTLLSGTVTA